MYETIKRIYTKTSNKDAVERAVEKSWITQYEANSILSTTIAPEDSPE